MSPITSPSMRRPSVNFRLPSIQLPWAIRLLMGGCFFFPNINRFPVAGCRWTGWRTGERGLTWPESEFGGLHVANRSPLNDFSCNSLYHGLGGQVEDAFHTAVLFEL